MPKYLFTSDLRISDLANRIKYVANYVKSGKRIANIIDKSENNNATTLAFYFNLHYNAEICKTASTDPIAAIRNYILKFQFPNTRTPESLNDSLNEQNYLAPYRAVVRILYRMAELDYYGESRITLDEILYYIFCNKSVYGNPNFLPDSIITSINEARNKGVLLDSLVQKSISWKQYQRQVREMMTVLTIGYKCFRLNKGILSFNNTSIEFDKCKDEIELMLSYNYIWYPSDKNNYSKSNKEYSNYMDTKETAYSVIDFTSNSKKEIPVFNVSDNYSYRPFITAIKSKPFLLLAGISGTGKSRIVRELARACWEEGSEEYKAQKPRNFEMVQVKPNWHDSSELIGYVSRIDGVRYVVGPFLRFMVKAMQDPETPYFLCLDEMNLAPVEQYFAEYLSVIESRKLQEDGTITTDPIVDYSNTEEYISLIQQLFPDDDLRKEYQSNVGGKRLSIPNNLIVVGTVNMDETTFSFSRKVLDRAMTIEMNKVELDGGLDQRYEKIGKLGAAELIGNAVEGVDVYSSYKGVCDTAIAYLQKINDVLEGTPFKIAYRTRNEVLLYVVNNLPYNKIEGDDESTYKEEFVIARALDEITNMKILSRIEGDESKVSKAFLDDLGKAIKEGLESVFDEIFDEDDDDVYTSVSLAKLDEMKKRLDSGYTSFWS